MRPSFLVPAISVAAFASVHVSGCSADGPTCSDYSPPASFDPTTPTATFSRDVVPIFDKSCASTDCHGLADNPNGVFLGSANGASAIYDNLVGRRASELPTMSFVTAGDPRNSYLMRKVDGSHCTLDAQCVNGTCGDAMPKDESRLPLETRDTLRRWIAQGAKND